MTFRCSIFALVVLAGSALGHPEALSPRAANVDLIGDQRNPNLALPKFSTTFRSLTAEGFQCQSPCILRRDVYQCHNLEEGWRYCSPEQNYAYNGRPCKDNSPCEFHMDHYSTCTTVDGERMQCGLKDDQEGPILTGAYNSFCLDKCENRGYKYSWCHSTHPSGYDYCSIEDNYTTTVGVKCNQGAECSFGPRIFRSCEVGYTVADHFWHCSGTKGALFKKFEGKIDKPDPAPVQPTPSPVPVPIQPTPSPVPVPIQPTLRPVLRPAFIPVQRPFVRWSTTHNVGPVQPSTYSDRQAIWTWVSGSGKK